MRNPTLANVDAMKSIP